MTDRWRAQGEDDFGVIVIHHAGECALCRAPFVRGEVGAVASCACNVER